MKQTIVSIYALVLCGICTIAFTGYTGTALYKLVRLTNPQNFIDSSEKTRLSSNDLFWQSLEEGRSALATKGRPAESELTLRRTARLEACVSEIKTSARSETIENSFMALLFTIIGLVHLFIYKRVSRPA